MNITEFLEARIAGDEKRANYYGPLAMGTARVLAECTAKRKLIAISEQVESMDLLKAIAAVYADHPAYNKEWAL